MSTKTKTEYVFEFGGEKYRVTQPFPNRDPDIWHVVDSDIRFFAEFDTDAESMATKESARNETRMALIADDKICCICETRTYEGDDGLCLTCNIDTFEERIGLDIYEMEDLDD